MHPHQAYPYPPPPPMFVKEYAVHQPPTQLIPNGKNPKKKSPFKKEEDQEIAGFLLSLKHSRSVSPEPSVASSETTHSTYSGGASAFYATGGYAVPPPGAHPYPPPPIRQHQPLPPPHHTMNPVPAPSGPPSTTGGGGGPHNMVMAAPATYHHHHHYAPPPQMAPHHYQYHPHHPPPPHMYPAYAIPYPPPHQQSSHPSQHAPQQISSTGSFQEMSREPSPPTEPVDLEKLIEDSPVVTMKERDLVPDVLFTCMAQMDIAQLGQADRVGCYKDRPIGFKGLSCRHCGGQPGFGRFFPNSVRSLAQTTTSQTIVKHVISKCRFTPAKVRNSIIELQHQQMARETNGRPRYGSRKIFFQRIWQKLHDGAPGKIDEYYDGGFAAASSSVDHVNTSKEEADEEDDVPVVASKISSSDLDDPALVESSVSVKMEDAVVVVTHNEALLPQLHDEEAGSSDDNKKRGAPTGNGADDDEDYEVSSLAKKAKMIVTETAV